MNKIILPPAILSALLPNHTRIESSDNHLYLLRETYKPNKITISNLYQLFFGSESSKKEKVSYEKNSDAGYDYYSSYE